MPSALGALHVFVGLLGQSSIVAATRTAEVGLSMGGDMDSWMSQGNSAGRKRVLVVEDELMIRMLLQDMLDDLGHTLAGEAGRIDEAMALAKQAEFDVAILDVNLNGEPISPVVEVLVQRGLPFVFATGYGQPGVPEPYRRTPTLQKPFQAEALEQALEAAARRRRN